MGLPSGPGPVQFMGPPGLRVISGLAPMKMMQLDSGVRTFPDFVWCGGDVEDEVQWRLFGHGVSFGVLMPIAGEKARQTAGGPSTMATEASPSFDCAQDSG